MHVGLHSVVVADANMHNAESWKSTWLRLKGHVIVVDSLYIRASTIEIAFCADYDHLRLKRDKRIMLYCMRTTVALQSRETLPATLVPDQDATNILALESP